ncbi:MAG: glycosyl hydrolase [Candidatus Eisenbacteria bacterium]|nr:glycosyl hydrolase [Candidatus Eisenbacteria bacterium]
MKLSLRPWRALAAAMLSATLVALAAGLAFAADSTSTASVTIDSDTFEGLRARCLGPAIMGGRVSCLDGVPGDRITLWVGTAGGGVWLSKDGATTWKPVFDKHTQSIGAIKVSPKDAKTVWVGTGESWVRNSVSVGDGIYKTIDGGDTWTRMGLEKTERIARIVVNPKHPDTVLVAATGPAFSDSPERGVYRTLDGGKTWTKVLYVNEQTGAADIAMDPQDPNTLYASMWQYRRKAWTFSSGGPGSGLYKSTDGGATWRRLTEGLPTGDLGRICVTVSPARASRVYAVVESKSTALYRSDDCGEHWTRLADGNANVTWRPFYFANIVADPRDFDRVYKGALTLSVSDDGGKTFSSSFGASYHSDVHAVWIDPRNPEWIVNGNDGGIAVSQDRGATWRTVQNMPVGQFYHVSYDMKTPYNVYGGLQDNGTWRGPSRRSGGIPNRAWESLNFGDGMWAFVDPADGDILYSEYQGGEVSRRVMSTGEAKSIRPVQRQGEPKLRFNWNAPLHVGPSSGALYMGAQYVFRTRDRGDSWERISPDLTTNDPLKQKQEESGGLSVDNSSAENHCTIVAIGESPKNANVVWAGTDDGNLQVTRDGGKTWNNVTRALPGLPANTWISYVSPSPFEEGTCFVTADGHWSGDMKSYVFVTRDWGATWTSLSTASLHGHAHVVKQDLVNPALLFLGTESGLFASLDSGRQWAQVKSGMPGVAVRDLAIHPREGDLLVGTHGRGIYVFDDLTPLRSLTAQVLASDAAFVRSRPSELAIPAGEQRFDGDTDWGAENLPESAVICYYLKKRHVIGEMRVELYDAAGKLIMTLPASKRRGLNRVEWPMRLKGPKIPAAANLVQNQYTFVGPRAPAGDYKVKLIRNKETYESTVTLVPDPRSTHSAADRAAQSVLVNRLYAMLGDLSFTAEAASSLRDTARARAAALPKKDALAVRLNAFANRLEAFRGTIVAAKEGGRLTGEIQLREELGDLYGKVNGYDGKPTESQQAMTDRLSAQLAKAQSDLEALLGKELPAVNGALAGRKLAPLKRETRPEWDARQAKS